MKNLKNTASAIALAAVLMVGTATARPAEETEITTQIGSQPAQCTVNYTNVIKGIVGNFIKQYLGNQSAFFVPDEVFENNAQTCSKNKTITTYGRIRR